MKMFNFVIKQYLKKKMDIDAPKKNCFIKFDN